MTTTITADTDLLLTVEEAARRLKIGRTQMYRLIASGEVKSVTIGRLRRVPAECLATYVSSLLSSVQPN
ncbi:helix-turn-helix domain-containing protein [Actinomadura decatromicini]|uniref:helix-turn-helix domain-containing protein n=1 Tax=Actinomadura decatromicini TaxID=2604572 RepID=UPI001FEAAEE8|nr:helix-turn-helix domain-containing protein [Actinomadura decatromicini]